MTWSCASRASPLDRTRCPSTEAQATTSLASTRSSPCDYYIFCVASMVKRLLVAMSAAPGSCSLIVVRPGDSLLSYTTSFSSERTLFFSSQALKCHIRPERSPLSKKPFIRWLHEGSVIGIQGPRPFAMGTCGFQS